jgi:hypothetical protein
MQRVGLLALAVLYLFTTVGAAVNVHYCMGRVSNVQWEGLGQKTTTCGASDDACSPCCRNELKVFKVSDVHQPSTAHLLMVRVPALSSLPLSFWQTPLLNACLLPVAVAHPPPPLASHTSLSVQHCQFRI